MSEDNFKRLGQIIARYHGTGAENLYDTAEIVGVCPVPSFDLVTAEGEYYNWRQDLTRPATEAEAIEYWKRRAASAERMLRERAASRKDGER